MLRLLHSLILLLRLWRHPYVYSSGDGNENSYGSHQWQAAGGAVVGEETLSHESGGRRQMVLSWLEEGTHGKHFGGAWAGWHPRGRARWRVLNNLRAFQFPVGKSWPWSGCTKFENSYFAQQSQSAIVVVDVEQERGRTSGWKSRALVYRFLSGYAHPRLCLLLSVQENLAFTRQRCQPWQEQAKYSIIRSCILFGCTC